MHAAPMTTMSLALELSWSLDNNRQASSCCMLCRFHCLLLLLSWTFHQWSARTRSQQGYCCYYGYHDAVVAAAAVDADGVADDANVAEGDDGSLWPDVRSYDARLQELFHHC